MNLVNDVHRQQIFNGIQALRFFAAFLVLMTHSTFFISSRMDSDFPIWKEGAQGVHIFFVISGFVMMITSRSLVSNPKGHFIFMINRIIRIVPLYWAVNLVKLAVWFAVPAVVFTNPDFVNILLSLLFIPCRDAANHIEPFYGAGWTLNFEMFFYAIFAIGLWLKLRALWFIGSLLLLLSIGHIFRQPDWPAISIFLNPIVLNFLYGVIIAELLYAKLGVSKIVAFVMVLFGLILTFFPPVAPLFGIANPWLADSPRPAEALFPPVVPLLGIQYAFLVAGVVFLEPYIKQKIPQFFVFGGDISYSLYLVHPLVGPVILTVLLKLQIIPPYLIIAIILVANIIAASLSYLYFERPVGIYLKRRFYAPRTARNDAK